MTVFSWMIIGFGTLMAGVCVFTYVQIERNAHQARQQQAAAYKEGPAGSAGP